VGVASPAGPPAGILCRRGAERGPCLASDGPLTCLPPPPPAGRGHRSGFNRSERPIAAHGHASTAAGHPAGTAAGTAKVQPWMELVEGQPVLHASKCRRIRLLSNKMKIHSSRVPKAPRSLLPLRGGRCQCQGAYNPLLPGSAQLTLPSLVPNVCLLLQAPTSQSPSASLASAAACAMPTTTTTSTSSWPVTYAASRCTRSVRTCVAPAYMCVSVGFLLACLQCICECVCLALVFSMCGA
jgi:hypothetical protein